MGGLFQLARRGPTAATLTIVCLDDEPAFEGVHLTALLTNDRALAERVRELCLVDGGTADGILDAAPRGLAEDERAVQTVIEGAIAREEAAWSAARSGTAKTSGISLAWRRVFHSESPEAVPEKTGPNPVPPPRGKNPWLARLAEAERQHRHALDQANAALESIRAQGLEQAARLQASIEEWKRRFEAAESEAAERDGRQAEALEETKRRSEELTRALAAREEREARVTAELEASAARADNQAAVSQREKADLQAALALATSRLDGLARKLEKVEEQYEAAVLEAREREEALRSQSRDEVLAAEALLRTAHENASLSSSRIAEDHAETLARLEARISAIDQDRDQVRNRLKSALADRERDASKHAALLAEVENARLVLVSRAQELEASQAEALTRIARLEDQTAQMTMLSVAAVAERDATALRLLQSEDAHRVALRLADERAAVAERERADETARIYGLVLEWQQRFDAAARDSIEGSHRLETSHAALVARLQDEVSQLRDQAESSAQVQAREAASAAERISLLEREKVTVEESSRETLRVAEQRTAAVESEKAEQTSRLNSLVREWQARFDDALKAAARESTRLEAHHSEMVARLQDELAGLARQGEAAALSHTRSEAFLAQRLAEVEQEKSAVSGERDELALRLGQLERDKLEEAYQLRALVDAGQARSDAAVAQAAAEAQRMEAEQARKDLVSEGQVAVIVAEKAGLARDRDELAARLRSADETIAQAQQASEKRVAALEREKAVEAVRANKIVATWQARFEAAAKAAAKQSQQLQARHAALLGRLQEKVAHLKEQANRAARDHVKQAASLSKQLSAMEREKAVLSGERGEAEARLRQAEERHHEAFRLAEERATDLRRETADEAARRLSVESAEWQSRFDAAAVVASLESQRLEAHHAAVVARLEDEVSRLRGQGEVAAKGHEAEAAALQQRLSLLEGEKVAAMFEGREAQTRWTEREEGYREALRAAEHRAAGLQIERNEERARSSEAVAEGQSRLDALARIHSKEVEALVARMSLLEREKAAALGEIHDAQSRLDRQEEGRLEKVEEAARLTAAVSEWKSRFDAATEARALEFDRLETGHGVHMARLQEEIAELRRQTLAAGERLSELEQEKAAFLGERNDVQMRMRELQEDHREKVEEAAQLKAALTEWQSRFEAAREGQKGESERRSVLEREKAAAVGDRDDLQTRLRQLEESNREAMRAAEQRATALQLEKIEEAARLNAAVAEWRSRFDATAKTAAKEWQRLEASHAALVARLQEDVDQLKMQGEAAAEGHGKEAAAMMERLSGLESEKNKAIERCYELERRLSQMEKEATRESQRLETRHGTEVKGLQEALTLSREKAEAAARDHAREAAMLAERLSMFERETARVSGERAGIETRLRQIEEGHREAMQLAEARLAEADARLGSAEARLAAAAESAKVASKGATQASESLSAALEARVLESGAHSKAVDAWEAHRAVLEQRIAELESAGSEPVFLQPMSRDEASSAPPDGGPPEWDFERVFKRAPEDDKNTLQDWVRGIARRVRRP